jgi:dTDP-4-dehydrorhamnose 3,5-epimerase-like enzyme
VLNDQLPITQLANRADKRGSSFSLSAEQLATIGSVQDVHIAEVNPGSIRGNHFHVARGELIAVVYNDSWSVHWDIGEGQPTHVADFVGAGAVIIAPPFGWSHAIRNDGRVSLWLFIASNQKYHSGSADAATRVVTGS